MLWRRFAPKYCAIARGMQIRVFLRANMKQAAAACGTSGATVQAVAQLQLRHRVAVSHKKKTSFVFKNHLLRVYNF